MVTLTSGEAQNRFGQLLDTAQREPVAITRHGRPAAFLISPQEMAELLDSRKRRGKAVTELEEWSQRIAGHAAPAAVALTDDEVNRASTADVHTTVRQARARPLFDNMKTWLDATLAKLSRKPDTAAAIRSALSRWKALTRYVDDGELDIDNNAAERALRVVALRRKSFLFPGSDASGEPAAAIYSLLGTAKLNGLAPELYLHHVLQRNADQPSARSTICCPGT